MSKQRLVDTCFWDDAYIMRLDPSEKLLFLYLLTNPLTAICGVYQIEMRRVAFDTGFEIDTVKRMLERFERDDRCVHRDGWMAMKNWLKHQNPGSPKVQRGIEIQLRKVPSELSNYVKGYGIDTLSHLNPNLNSNPNPNLEDTLSGDQESPDPKVAAFLQKQKQEEKRVPVKEIIDYFNTRCKTNFNPKSDYVLRLIKARWNEGYHLEDFKAVINVKARQWISDPKMIRYLRPITLFASSKFDSYLNESRQKSGGERRICPKCGTGGGLHLESCEEVKKRSTIGVPEGEGAR
jgi:uncharacterized phage protein (TIGR02220 family)